MSFWSNIKKATAATVETLNHAASLAADAAEVMRASTEILAMKSHVSLLEKEIDSPGVLLFSALEKSEKRKELLLKYDELVRLVRLVRLVDEDEGRHVLHKKRLLLDEVRDNSIRAKVDEIRRTQSKISISVFSLPVEEIGENKALLSKIDRLIDILRSGDKHGVLDLARKSRDSVLVRIEALERLRKEEVRTEFSSGALKSCVEFYDGKPHGIIRCWYENGTLKTEANFSNGSLSGHAKHWFEGGGLMVEAIFKPEEKVSEFDVFLKDGTKVLHFEDSSGDGFADCWLWDGVRLGRVYFRDKKPRKVGFILRVILNVKLWRSLWVSWREGCYRERFGEMAGVFRTLPASGMV